MRKRPPIILLAHILYSVTSGYFALRHINQLADKIHHLLLMLGNTMYIAIECNGRILVSRISESVCMSMPHSSARIANV